MLTTALQGGCYYFVSFTEEETDTWRLDEGTASWHVTCMITQPDAQKGHT